MELTGRTFGRWTVVEKSAKVGKNRVAYWTCRCECGTVKDVMQSSLVRGRSNGCGCSIDLTGLVFQRWTVIGNSTKAAGDYHSYWTCRCECGTVKDVNQSSLTRGLSRSCGCVGCRTHGACTDRGPVYNAWLAMRQRCLNPKCKLYAGYGGRGITICARWDDFASFRDDMGERPSAGHSIDRIDNDGHYCPENCRWAIRKEQVRNTRTNRLLTVDGVTRTMAEWTEISGFERGVIASRLRRGWDAARAVSVPPGTTR